MDDKEFFHKLGVWMGLSLSEERETELYNQAEEAIARRQQEEGEQ